MQTKIRKSALVSCLLAVMGLAAVSNAHADKLADVRARGKLICGTQNASAPYAFQDTASRSFVGYDVDICKALAKGLGVLLEHKPLSTEARVPELKMDRVDVVAGAMAYLPERAQQLDFSLQYQQGAIKVVVKKSSGIKTLADLAGKKICASKGSSSAAVATRVLSKSQVLTFQDISSCYLALQNDKVEGFTAGELILKRFETDSAKTAEPTVMLDEPTYVEHIGLVVQKGNPEFLGALNKVLVDLDKSGELTAIYDKWIGKGSVYDVPRRFKVEPVNL
jgi:polar amino acid transport system substrate-binding protein